MFACAGPAPWTTTCHWDRTILSLEAKLAWCYCGCWGFGMLFVKLGVQRCLPLGRAGLFWQAKVKGTAICGVLLIVWDVGWLLDGLVLGLCWIFDVRWPWALKNQWQQRVVCFPRSAVPHDDMWGGVLVVSDVFETRLCQRPPPQWLLRLRGVGGVAGHQRAQVPRGVPGKRPPVAAARPALPGDPEAPWKKRGWGRTPCKELASSPAFLVCNVSAWINCTYSCVTVA